MWWLGCWSGDLASTRRLLGIAWLVVLLQLLGTAAAGRHSSSLGALGGSRSYPATIGGASPSSSSRWSSLATNNVIETSLSDINVRDLNDLNLKASVEGNVGRSWRWGMRYDHGKHPNAPTAAFLRGNVLQSADGQALDVDVAADFVDRSLWGRVKAGLTPYIQAVVEADSREESYVTGVGLQTRFGVFGRPGQALGVYRVPTRDVAFQWEQFLDRGRTSAQLSSVVPVDQERVNADTTALLKLNHRMTAQDSIGGSVNMRKLADFNLHYNRRLSQGGLARVTFHPERSVDMVWTEPSKFGDIVFSTTVPVNDPSAATASCKYRINCGKLL